MLHWPIREKVALRLPEERFAGELLAVINRNRTDLEQWLPWAATTRTEEDIHSFVRHARSEFQVPQALHFTIFCEGKAAGGCGLKIVDSAAGIGDIGYWLDRVWQGKGIITDCCRALIKYGFEWLNLNRIQIRCAPENARSTAVAKRLGLHYEGILRESLRVGDRLLDLQYYSILRREWHHDQWRLPKPQK